VSHKLGQVFLKDLNILNKIVDFSDLSSTDTVLEIGCGEGVLTIELAKRVKEVIVVEVDEKCIEMTKKATKEFTNITFIHHDILTFDLKQLKKESVKVVANIPYYISAKIVKWLISNRLDITYSILMTQKEFAEKLNATPGMKTYTSLTLFTQSFFDASFGFNVSNTCFKPVPAVDSSVVKLIPKEFVVDDSDLFNVIRSGFWGRRKPFLSALKKSPYISLDNKGLNTLPFFMKNPKVRAEMLSLTEFQNLLSEIKEHHLL
jgi:16S rRNA (adenine1518-N6/adenine1519-N6)-dimethyltransferase